MDIDTSDIPEEKIPANMQLSPNREGKYQAGLYQSWELLSRHDDAHLKQFWQEEKNTLLDLLQSRNHSILAHGFEPVSENAWQNFARWAEEKLLPLLQHFSQNDPWRIKKLPPQLPTNLP